MTNIYFKPEKCFHLCRPSAAVVLINSPESGFLFVHTFVHVWNVAFMHTQKFPAQHHKQISRSRLRDSRDESQWRFLGFFFSVFQPVEFYCSHFAALFFIRQFCPGYLLGLGAEKLSAALLVRPLNRACRPFSGSSAVSNLQKPSCNSARPQPIKIRAGRLECGAQRWRRRRGPT